MVQLYVRGSTCGTWQRCRTECLMWLNGVTYSSCTVTPPHSHRCERRTYKTVLSGIIGLLHDLDGPGGELIPGCWQVMMIYHTKWEVQKQPCNKGVHQWESRKNMPGCVYLPSSEESDIRFYSWTPGAPSARFEPPASVWEISELTTLPVSLPRMEDDPAVTF